MSIRNTIDILKDNLNTYVITDTTEACKKILKSKMVVFLDTCFMSSLMNIDETLLSELLERLVGEEGYSSVTLVITELVLYESRDPRDNTVQQFVDRIIDVAKKKSISTVLLKEEGLYKELLPFFFRGYEDWNNLFLERLKENKANLTKVRGLIGSDKEQLFDDTFVISAAKIKDKEFIFESILGLKERKSDRDSLAEELICVVLFFLLELFLNSLNKKIIFCSNDNQALAKIKMTLTTSYGNMCSCFENIHFFTLIQYMVKKNILTDKIKVEDLLRKNMSDRLRAIEKKELPYVESEQVMDLKEIVDGMFDGKVYQYKGK